VFDRGSISCFIKYVKKWKNAVKPHRIIPYDRATDEAGGVINVPHKQLGRILVIAAVADPNESGELLLDEDQIREMAKLIGFAADVARFHYHLEPVGPALATVSA
jgi:hypothetical protein